MYVTRECNFESGNQTMYVVAYPIEQDMVTAPVKNLSDAYLNSVL